MENKVMTLKNLLDSDNIKKKFTDILKAKASGFTANLAVLVNNNEMLKRCDPVTIISAAIVSASLDLPLDPNLGFAYIIPYGDKASFQLGYKAFVQLGQRSGQYKTINVTEVYDGELISANRLTGEYVFDFSGTAKKSEKIIGYAAYFKLLNGFEKTEYWDASKADQHGKRFSQTYKKGFGLWKDDFNAMAKKSVLKSLLSKWGILSIEMQNAVKFDQGVIHDVETGEVEYVDNEEVKNTEPAANPLKPKKEKPAEPEQNLNEVFK